VSGEVDGWISFSRNILKAKGVMSCGDHIPLGLTEKVVLVWMDDRTNYFIGEGKTHFESQGKIGEALDLDRKTVGRVLNGLVDKGLLVATKKGRGYNYSGVDISSLTFYFVDPPKEDEINVDTADTEDHNDGHNKRIATTFEYDDNFYINPPEWITECITYQDH